MFVFYLRQAITRFFNSGKKHATQIVPTISVTFTYPYEKMTAFGGVATGNMKAKEQAMAVGNIK